jgi:stearoyl-CoA desaturase (delta-9 desaturase)
MAIQTPQQQVLPSLNRADLRREGGGRRGMLLVQLALHGLCVAAIWADVSLWDLVLCFGLVQVRGFCVSGGYHRYFAHRSFQTSRWFAFLLAAGGCTVLRGGPLWWTALHRHHHCNPDSERDNFRPEDGFWWCYAGWLFSGRFTTTDYARVRDLTRYPELCWLNRWWLVPPVLLGLATYLLFGWSGFLVGFCLSSVLLFHTMALLDACAHSWGSRRYATPDTSVNNAFLSLLCMGEGWHNNHHHYPASARQGFSVWEVDGTYTGLQALAMLGLIWKMRIIPEPIIQQNLLVPRSQNEPVLGPPARG